MLFIEKYFVNYFKRLNKVLADELRHDLVHGFGSLGRPAGVALAVAVNSDTDIEIKVGQLRRRNTMALNAVAFSEQFLTAFRRVKHLVDTGKDPALVSRVACAARLELRIVEGVQNQFETIYREAERKGLVTTFGRRRRARVC